MWVQEIYDTLFDPNTICVACISHGKDSNAMLRAIKLLGLPLHRIVTTDVWATQDIPAELPEMHAWKAEADARIKELYGIEVEHICAMQKERFPISDERKAEVEGHALSDLSQFVQVERESGSGGCLRLSYEELFYRQNRSGQFVGSIKGFPQLIGSWCKKLKFEEINIPRYILQSREERANAGQNVRLPDTKVRVVPRRTQGELAREDSESAFSSSPTDEGRKYNIVQYLGIAADEPIRIARHIGRKNIVLPLVEIGWEEDLCGLISGYQNLLSPTYETSMRDGCWFCHNQGVEQLRNLRKKHPDLWALLLKWDADSPGSFKPDGHTVHDFDARFALEDQGLITPSDPWKWAYLTDMPIQLKMNF